MIKKMKTKQKNYLFNDNNIQVVFSMNVKQMNTMMAIVSYYINTEIEQMEIIVIHDVNKKEYLPFTKCSIQQFDGGVDTHFISLEKLLRDVLDK